MSKDDTITRIPLDPKARHEGYLAGRRGQTGDDNPYQVGTCEALAWGKVLAFVALGSLFNLTGTLWNLGVAWSAARIVLAGKGIGRIRIWLERGRGAMFVFMGARLALVER